MYEKVVSLGSRLRYPITITKLLKSPGDAVKKQETIIEYKFTWRRKISDDEWTDETTYTEYDSPAEGTLKEWRIREGQVIAADVPCMMVEEACSHEVQMAGLCSLCGMDMTEINWASEERDTDRAMVNMTHDQTGLMVSQDVATRAEHDTQKRLLRQRKLSLVVDLDQTIIHACIEPTVGEWQKDPTNPNHDAVKDVKSFQLNEDGPRGLASGCAYYIKLRPGLKDFLEEISTMYEMHVYTMGTRAYALNIARIVDPDNRLFGNRVISRDENGSIHAKSLQRLFPVSTDMVVIIDDRADVWPMNRPNLIKVTPYDFFKGIGDINSSFLPKRQDIIPTAENATSNGSAGADGNAAAAASAGGAKPSPLEELAKMGANGEEALKVQTEEQEKTLEKQLTDRPLLHMQEELDKEDKAAEDTESGASSVVGHRQHLLSDDDEELIALQDHLTDLHQAFYETYDKRREERPPEPEHGAGHNKARRRSSVDDGVDLSMVPDVGMLLDALKSNVLSGTVIVLSGIVPLGVKVEESEIGMQAQGFGAQVLDSISKRVTHLVVSTARPRTKKVQQAAKIPSIKIVNQNWLMDCLSQWRRLDERPYYIEILDADREKSGDTTDAASDVGDSDSNANDIKDLDDIDWDQADEEMREFMGDDDEDDDDEDGDGDGDEDKSDAGDSNQDSEAEPPSDTESTNSKTSPTKGTKRKLRADEDPSAADGDSNNSHNNNGGDSTTAANGESILAKKQRVARSRGASGLRSVHTPEADDGGEGDRRLGGGGISASQGSGGEGGGSQGGSQVNTDQGQDFDEDDLERELLAEFEAAEG